MHKILLVFLLTLSGYIACGQNEQPKKNMEVIMNREAHYPEGDNALFTYIFNHLQYSEEAKAAKISGTIMLSFWVEKDSTLADIKTLTDVGYGVGENLKSLMKDINYVPALLNGVVMRSKVIITVPVRAR